MAKALCWGVLLLVGVGLGAPAALAGRCPDGRAVSDARALIAQNDCACDVDPSGVPWRNHGGYVRCVAHAANDLVRAGTLPKSCKGEVRRCAARSVCGKPGFVTCLFVRPGSCVGDDAPGDGVAAGACKKTGKACDTDTGCPRCTLKRDVEHCVARGGVVGTASSCCDAVLVVPPD